MSDVDLVALFPADLQAQAARLLPYSPYLQTQLAHHPEWVETLCDTTAYTEGELVQHIATDLATVTDEQTLLQRVRHIRHQESMRIIWRELSGAACVEETLRTTSDLADGLVDSVLHWWHAKLVEKHGEPRNQAGEAQYMLVLGMGKLGGRELNFSSDIDLIFTFPDSGETDGRRCIDNQNFFTRLGQKLINTLGQMTADGFAYRVDMRLRPFGESGALALSFDAMEHYYQTHGREWERYALVKARVMTQDQTQAGEDLMQRLRPFIYRRYLDYGAVEQLRDMKIRINREAQRKGKRNDVKLGRGGIREVEFTAQVFQLMRGGRERELQQRNLLKTLDVLETLELLTPEEVSQLRAAYCFLRQTENRLQMWQDEQTHALPDEAAQCTLLAESMDFADWDAFAAVLKAHREQVAAIFQRVFAVEDDKPEQDDLIHVWQGDLDAEQAQAVLAEWQFLPAEAAWEQLQALRNGRLFNALTDVAHKRLDRLMPDVLQACAKQTVPLRALERSLEVIQAIARRSGYMAMLADHPAALEQFVKLVQASSWITTELTQHPILLDMLLDTRELYHPLNRAELQAALQAELARVDPEDTGAVMERMRQFKQAQVLRVAAADISGHLPLMVVSDQLTWIAEVILQAAADNIWQVMTAKHGVPCYTLDGELHEAGFGIIAYGKLGGLELGYGSDLDIVFLHDSTGQNQQSNGAKPLENQVFFVRLAQKIIHLLATFTHDGRLYETDTRLRPSGASGLLVSSLDAFRQYQQEKAWIWEHQALLRSRAVTGSRSLQAGFEAIRQAIVCQPRDTEALRQEVVSMREKMWAALGSKDEQLFDLKKDPGGITDIEFMVQYLILAHAQQQPALAQWSDNIRQLDSLQEADLLSSEQAEGLQTIYRHLRNRVHECALQEQDAKVAAAEFSEERAFVAACWAALMQPPAQTVE